MSSPLLRRSCALCLTFAFSIFAQAPQQSASPEIVQHKLNEPQLAVAWSPDGKRVISSGQNRAVRQFDARGKELDSMRNGPGGWSASFAPDGRFVAVCGLDRSIRLWEPQSGAEHRQLDGHLSTAWVACFHPDGHRMLSVGEDGTIRIWNPDDGKEINQIVSHPGPIWCMALSNDGRWMATGGSDGVVRLWDMQTGRIRRACESSHSGGVWPLAFAPDGRTLVSAGWQDGKIFLWETATGKLRRQVPHPTGAKAVAFMPNGSTLITAGNDSVIRFWDLPTAKELPPLEGHRGVVNGIAVSPDGATLASASADGTFRLWDLSRRHTSLKPAQLPQKQLESCWAALQRDAGSPAFEAIGALTSSPEQTLALLRERLQPAPTPDVQKISLLIERTNHSKYAIRQAATADLERLGEEAESHLQQAVQRPGAPETRRRAEKLLEKLQHNCIRGETLRGVRCIEVLERIGTAEACELLERLAAGAPDARLTLEARASLQRIKR